MYVFVEYWIWLLCVCVCLSLHKMLFCCLHWPLKIKLNTEHILWIQWKYRITWFSISYSRKWQIGRICWIQFCVSCNFNVLPNGSQVCYEIEIESKNVYNSANGAKREENFSSQIQIMFNCFEQMNNVSIKHGATSTNSSKCR